MRLRCPHCLKVIELADEDTRGFFMVCKDCGKRFRMNETTPLTQKADGGKNGAQAAPAGVFGSNSANVSQMRICARHNAKGAELFRLGKLPEAEKELRRSLQLNSDQPKVQRMLEEIERARLAPR